MVNPSYVFPNVSGIRQRGGLLERWAYASELGCEYVEVPADFIKNKTETEKTGLELCAFLTDDAIVALYQKDAPYSPQLKYILHTEPSLPRNDGYGISNQAHIKWYDSDWVARFIDMTISISRYIGLPASVIEIHPGDRRNSFANVIDSIKVLLDKYRAEFGVDVTILLENRTGQFISSGQDIANFWEVVPSHNPGIQDNFGVILDIQQLYTVTKADFIDELNLIPNDCIKGLHIHTKHRLPSYNDEIPWKLVFSKMAGIDHKVIINPEIHHKNRVKDVIEFCDGMLRA